MSNEELTLENENINAKEGISIVKVRDVQYTLDIDDSIWTTGPQKFAQVPAWSNRGQIRPENKRGLPSTNNTKWLKKIAPFKNFQIFQKCFPPT